jgi:ATP-binding cassette subfamily C protein
MIVPMLLTAVLEMASIGMILPLIELIMGGSSSRIMELMTPYLPDLAPQELLTFIGLIFAAFFVVKNIFIMSMIVLINRFTNRNMALFLQKMYGLYLNRPYTFHLQRNSADIQRNLNYSAPVAFDGLRLILGLVMESVLVVAAGILLLLVEPVVTIAAAVLLGGVSLGFFLIAGPRFRAWGKISHDLQGDMLRHINVSLGTITDIKLLWLYGFMNSVYQRLTNTQARYLTLSLSAQHAPRLFVESIIVIGFLAFIASITYFRGSTEGLIPMIGLFGMAALRLMPSMNRILHNATELRHRTAPIETLYQDLIEGLQDSENAPQKIGTTIDFHKEIYIEGLSYTYPNETEPALQDISMRLARGGIIGLVGPSGAGKTTFIGVLLGFLKPDTGRFLVDGKNVLENLHAWRAKLGYVPQSIFLMDDTLRRNIAFGCEDDEINEDRTRESVRLAGLEEVVAGLPHGLDTVVGEHGARLSGGQRQRVGIARALYRNPEILVLDEATSALDNETERDITAAIKTLSGDKTILIIAHRLSTVRHCDQLIFMKDGRIAATGTFEELASSNADFKHLVQLGDLDSGAVTA